jgi:uncharacterized protein (TIGR03086 family)
MTNPSDPRPLLRGAFAQATAVVEAVTPDRLGDPTPCTEFDVRGLLGHFLAIADRVGALPAGRDIQAMPTTAEVGDDAVTDFADRAARAMDAWADDALLTRTFSLPWGESPGFAAVGAYFMEVSTHTWDLATATAWKGSLDPALGEAAVAIAQQSLPPTGREGFPFADPQPVADDADPWARLAAWTGRRPTPAR